MRSKNKSNRLKGQGVRLFLAERIDLPFTINILLQVGEGYPKGDVSPPMFSIN